MDFSDKVAVVTGGANGIGRCIVQSFVERGAFVAFIDMDQEAGEMLHSAFPSRTLFLPGDITEEKILEEFTEQVIKRLGHVDYLINNACLSRKGILSGCGFADFNYVLKLGITAPYILAKNFLPAFAESGAIVNISSTRAFQSQADTESYTAAKGGITALTHALSISLAGRIRVNSISPGWIETGAYHGTTNFVPEYDEGDLKQHPSGRVGRPEDIAHMVLFLCSEEASFITGENITIDGGMTKQMIYHKDFGWTFLPEH